MAGYNHVTLVGNLGKDPELRHTANGQAVAGFSLAVGESWKDRDGQKQERTTWLNVVAWGKTGELCARYLKKGRQALIDGRIQVRKYTGKDGVERTATEIVASSVQFIGGNPNRDDAGASTGNYEDSAPPPVGDDDIPF